MQLASQIHQRYHEHVQAKGRFTPHLLRAGGKPSTWLPPGRLVEPNYHPRDTVTNNKTENTYKTNKKNQRRGKNELPNWNKRIQRITFLTQKNKSSTRAQIIIRRCQLEPAWEKNVPSPTNINAQPTVTTTKGRRRQQQHQQHQIQKWDQQHEYFKMRSTDASQTTNLYKAKHNGVQVHNQIHKALYKHKQKPQTQSMTSMTITGSSRHHNMKH